MPVHTFDDVQKHLASHMQAKQLNGDPANTFAVHIQEHLMQAAAQNAAQVAAMAGGQGCPAAPAPAYPADPPAARRRSPEPSRSLPVRCVGRRGWCSPRRCRRPAASSRRGGSEMWEYKIECSTDQLNSLGRAGWELVLRDKHGNYVLKRLLKETEIVATIRRTRAFLRLAGPLLQKIARRAPPVSVKSP